MNLHIAKVLSKTWKKLSTWFKPSFPSAFFVFHLFKNFSQGLKKKKKAALISNTVFRLPWRIKVSDCRTLFFLISFSNKAEQTSWNIWELPEFPSNLGSRPTHDIPLCSLLWRHLEMPFIFFHFLIGSLILHVSYWNKQSLWLGSSQSLVWALPHQFSES